MDCIVVGVGVGEGGRESVPSETREGGYPPFESGYPPFEGWYPRLKVGTPV